MHLRDTGKLAGVDQLGETTDIFICIFYVKNLPALRVILTLPRKGDKTALPPKNDSSLFMIHILKYF